MMRLRWFYFLKCGSAKQKNIFSNYTILKLATAILAYTSFLEVVVYGLHGVGLDHADISALFEAGVDPDGVDLLGHEVRDHVPDLHTQD
jgi:hypothetical protein